MLARWDCYACHERGGHGGQVHRRAGFFIGDPCAGRCGQDSAAAHHGGRKARSGLDRGRAPRASRESRVRPYLKTRMPVYPARGRADDGGVIRETSLDSRRLDAADRREIAEVDDLEAGRRLLGTHGGCDCISCHRWGDRHRLAFRGMDLADLDKRIETAHGSASFLLGSARYRPATLMPALWPGGDSSEQDVLGGDTEQQIGAIWAFIRDGAGHPEGFPERSTGHFELVPKIVRSSSAPSWKAWGRTRSWSVSLAVSTSPTMRRKRSRGWFGVGVSSTPTTPGSRVSRRWRSLLKREMHRFGENADGRRFLGYRLDRCGWESDLPFQVEGGHYDEEFFCS